MPIGPAFVELARSELLDGLDPVSRRGAAALLAGGHAERLVEGSLVPLPVGSAGLAVVASGEVEVVAFTGEEREIVLALVRGGEVVTSPPDGLDVGGSPVLVRAMRDSVIYGVDHDRLRALARFPRLLLNLVTAVSARTDEAQQAALRMAHRRVDDRVLLALRALAARTGKVTRDGVRVGPVRHRDLARLANVTRPGATQAVSSLCASGDLVRLDDGQLLLSGGPSVAEPEDAFARVTSA